MLRPVPCSCASCASNVLSVGIIRMCALAARAALPGASLHAPDVRVRARGLDGVANYKGVAFMTSAGPVTASIPNAHVA